MPPQPGLSVVADDTTYGDGTIHVAFDESFSPLVCVGATVAETEFASTNDEIMSLYRELTNYSWMADMTSFKRFVGDGFHMSNDAQAIADRFVGFLGHAIGFSSYVFYAESDRFPRGRTTLLLYRELVRTVLQKYASRPLIRCYFEQNEEFNQYFPKIVSHCLRSVRRPRPRVEVFIRPKMQPPLLAVCDYSMLTFARWFSGYQDCPAQTDSTRHFTWRNFNALRRSYSVIRSLESGNLVQRGLPFEQVLPWQT